MDKKIKQVRHSAEWKIEAAQSNYDSAKKALTAIVANDDFANVDLIIVYAQKMKDAQESISHWSEVTKMFDYLADED